MPEPAAEETPRPRVSAAQIGAVAARPGFVVGHVVVLVLAVTTVWLGRWQWHAAHVHHGSVQNYAYAFQWWIFCAFGIAMWIRIMRDRAARDLERAAGDLSAGRAVPSAADRHAASTAAVSAAPAGYRGYVMPTAAQIVDDPGDPVRAGYNAALGERHSTAG